MMIFPAVEVGLGMELAAVTGRHDDAEEEEADGEESYEGEDVSIC